jgi:glucosamine kinase
MQTMIEFWIGVDGGGTGTRVRLQHVNGTVLSHGSAGPSGLMHGSVAAWRAIDAAINSAFERASLSRPPAAKIALGLGLAGVHNPQWASEFITHDPGYALLALETDAFTTLLGAHQGQAGAIVALGTGSVGEALLPDQSRREVGGWGFPVGDEASGAWLGLRAVGHTQQTLDGRAERSDFSEAIFAACGGSRPALFGWLSQANQTRYAELAPIVIAHASHNSTAQAIMRAAGQEAGKIASALDPSGKLPLALCGGLAKPMQAWLPATILARLVPAHDDATGGAIHLIRLRLSPPTMPSPLISTLLPQKDAQPC